MADPVIWGFKAVRPFDAEHPVGSGKMVHYDPGDEVPASDWGRAEGFMVEAGTIMRYARDIATVPNPLPPPPDPSTQLDPPVPTANDVPPEPEPVAEEQGDGDQETETAPDIEVPEDATFPHGAGGGWFVLSDGERVRGKAAAIAAQAALDVAAEGTAE